MTSVNAADERDGASTTEIVTVTPPVYSTEFPDTVPVAIGPPENGFVQFVLPESTSKDPPSTRVARIQLSGNSGIENWYVMTAKSLIGHVPCVVGTTLGATLGTADAVILGTLLGIAEGIILGSVL